jgi:hypothetical protein
MTDDLERYLVETLLHIQRMCEDEGRGGRKLLLRIAAEARTASTHAIIVRLALDAAKKRQS